MVQVAQLVSAPASFSTTLVQSPAMMILISVCVYDKRMTLHFHPSLFAFLLSSFTHFQWPDLKKFHNFCRNSKEKCTDLLIFPLVFSPWVLWWRTCPVCRLHFLMPSYTAIPKVWLQKAFHLTERDEWLLLFRHVFPIWHRRHGSCLRQSDLSSKRWGWRSQFSLFFIVLFISRCIQVEIFRKGQNGSVSIKYMQMYQF